MQIRGNNGNQSDIFFLKEGNAKINKVRLNNQSNIVFGDCNEDFSVKKNTTSNIDFEPKYKTESAYNRRMKEFYSISSEDKKNSVTSRGTLTKQYHNTFKNKISDPSLSAKDRKLLENFPNQTFENIQEYKPLTDRNEKNYDHAKKPIHNLVKSLTSNIFNDSNKDEYNKNIRPNLEPKQLEVKEEPKIIQEGKWDANIDWKNSKYEIIFRKEYESLTDGCNSAFERKIKMMYDHINDKPMNISYTKTEEEKNKEFQNNIAETFQKYKKNYPNLRKSIDMTSSIQSQEFYEKLLKIDKQDRPVSEYEMNVDDVNNMNLKDFEKRFIKKGIHIYDISTQSDINNKTGRVVFKVRENDVGNDFKKKFDDVKTELTKEGLNLTPSIKKTTRTKTDTLPCTLKWDNDKMSNYVKGKPNLVSTNNKMTAIKNDTFSKTFRDVNHKYKSNKK